METAQHAIVASHFLDELRWDIEKTSLTRTVFDTDDGKALPRAQEAHIEVADRLLQLAHSFLTHVTLLCQDTLQGRDFGFVSSARLCQRELLLFQSTRELL